MTDGVAITAGSGTTVATDDCGTPGHAQIMKLAVATDGSATLIPADANGLKVNAFDPGTVDSFGHVVVGQINNFVDVQFYRDPSPANLVTVTTNASGTATTSGGCATFTTSSSTGSYAKGVTAQSVIYTAGAEIYALFTAAFTGTGTGDSYQRIGLYDSSDGIFIGFEGGTFYATVRTSGSPGGDTRTAKASFNGDVLTGAAGSLFTRAGSPEAIDLTKLNVFRIRLGWVGSAPIKFEVLSPDGHWVTFHTVRQPNLYATPSIANADLPITCDVNNGSGTAVIAIKSNCWCGGTTARLSKLNATLSTSTLAQTTRSVLTGETTAGGGAFVNVKVNPSGTLAVAADTELPAAATLGDNTANPSVPGVGAFVMNYDGSTWDRWTGAVTEASGAAIKTAVEIMDDWDESDRAKVNPIVGQAGITAGAGTVAVNTPRVTLASDDPVTTSVQIMDDWDESDRAKVNPIVGQAGITAGAGAVAANTPRVTHASDDPVTTSVQLIDDAIVADDAGFTAATTKVMMAGFVLDNTATDVLDENDAGAARVTSDRRQIVALGESGANYVRGGGSKTDTTAQSIMAASGDAAISNFLCWVTVYNSSATNTAIEIRDGTTTVVAVIPAPAYGGAVFQPTYPIKGTANTAFNAYAQTGVSTLHIYGGGYKAV